MIYPARDDKAVIPGSHSQDSEHSRESIPNLLGSVSLTVWNPDGASQNAGVSPPAVVGAERSLGYLPEQAVSPGVEGTPVQRSESLLQGVHSRRATVDPALTLEPTDGPEGGLHGSGLRR